MSTERRQKRAKGNRACTECGRVQPGSLVLGRFLCVNCAWKDWHRAVAEEN
jgi:hypothetical protein